MHKGLGLCPWFLWWAPGSNLQTENVLFIWDAHRPLKQASPILVLDIRVQFKARGLDLAQLFPEFYSPNSFYFHRFFYVDIFLSPNLLENQKGSIQEIPSRSKVTLNQSKSVKGFLWLRLRIISLYDFLLNFSLK